MTSSLPELQSCRKNWHCQQWDARFHNGGVDFAVIGRDAFLSVRQPVPQGLIGQPAAQLLHGRGIQG